MIDIKFSCERFKQVIEVYPSIGEKAFLAVCIMDRSHAVGFYSALKIRPKYKKIQEFMNIGDGT